MAYKRTLFQVVVTGYIPTDDKQEKKIACGDEKGRLY